MAIGDFGLSYSFYSVLSSSTKLLCGTRIYMSPEQLRGEEYGKVTVANPGCRCLRAGPRGVLPVEPREAPVR